MRLRNTILIFLATVSFVAVSQAQVEKSVEVTKEFAPKVADARKKSVKPNMVDTVRIYPEIDYTITPRSFSSTLTTSRFRPAMVTYWEYNRQYPFYIKAGLGYPFNSVADFYATTHRADVGYLTAYVNHEGRYDNITVKDPGLEKVYDNASMRLINRVGVTGGKYVGRYTFDGDIYYESDVYNRYPYEKRLEQDPREINYENAALQLGFGDSFSDLSRFNFKVYGSADFYNDKSEQLWYTAMGEPTFENKIQQISASAGIKIARNIGRRSSFSLSADYKGWYGLREAKAYTDNLFSATLLFAHKTKRMLDFKVGATYAYDRLKGGTEKPHHILPYLYIGLNVRDNGRFVPFIELESKLQNNSYQELQRRNPYVAMLGYESLPMADRNRSLDNTTVYNVRFGFTGHTQNCKFAYRLYANMSFVKNSLYWYNIHRAFFGVEQARENIWSLSASVEYKPISSLLIELAAKGQTTSSFASVASAKPSYEAMLRLRYTHRKFAIGAKAQLVGPSIWTSIVAIPENADFDRIVAANPSVKLPMTVDVGLDVDWFVSKHCTIFVEGRNLANANIYRWAYYREYGVHFTAGVKVQF